MTVSPSKVAHKQRTTRPGWEEGSQDSRRNHGKTDKLKGLCWRNYGGQQWRNPQRELCETWNHQEDEALETQNQEGTWETQNKEDTLENQNQEDTWEIQTQDFKCFDFQRFDYQNSEKHKNCIS